MSEIRISVSNKFSAIIDILTLDGIEVLLPEIPMNCILPILEGPMSVNFTFYHIYSVNSLALAAPKDKGGLFKDYFIFTSNLLPSSA